MEELKRLLGQTDDEYFIGLSNKGIVKRAYKDLEQENPKAEWSGKEAEVTLAGAVCRIRIPLGESTCSCPSRSVCRHLIGAMLFLKREAFREEEKEEQGQEQILGEELKKEILAVPLKNLKKSCGNRKYREFLEHVKSGEQPDIYEGAVITVRLPWEGVTVKLLSPLSYSTCSCHSKELCGHKAQAVLACQLKAGEHIAIIGAGAIGLLAGMGALAYDAIPILVDVVEERLELARSFGIPHTVNPARGDAVAQIMEITKGRGVECCMEASGSDAGVRSTLDYAAYTGRIALTGWPKHDITLPTNLITKKELHIRGSRNGAGEFEEAIELIYTGKVPAEKIISKVVPYTQLPHMLGELTDHPGDYLKVVGLFHTEG